MIYDKILYFENIGASRSSTVFKAEQHLQVWYVFYHFCTCGFDSLCMLPRNVRTRIQFIQSVSVR